MAADRAFGKGIHFCIGAPLSRLELEVAVDALARRLRTIRLTRPDTLEYHPSFVLRGLTPARCGVHGGPVASVA